MQAIISAQTGPVENRLYILSMGRKLSKPRPPLGARLAELRAAAGLSQYELARLVGQPQANVAYWEKSGKPPRSEVLMKMAEVLGVRVEDLLAENGGRKRPAVGGPVGKVRKLFTEVSKLPKRQQEKVVEFVSAFVNQQKESAG